MLDSMKERHEPRAHPQDVTAQDARPNLPSRITGTQSRKGVIPRDVEDRWPRKISAPSQQE